MEANRATFFLHLLLALIALFMHLKTHGAAVEGGDAISLGASLIGNQTIISKNGTFELGFFSPNDTNNWYIGIWYAQISERPIVWVANRETPIRNMPGVLNLSRDGHLRLFDVEGAFVWSPNVIKKASGAVILDSGNFVMLGKDIKSQPVWQTFDYPVDTWLPGMMFGGQQKLVGWKNSMDPAPGLFSFQADPSGVRQFVLSWNNSVQYSKTGVWDGKSFADIPELSQTSKTVFNLSVINSSSGLYMTYAIPATILTPSRFVVDKAGALRHYSFADGKKWSMFWTQPRDQCNVYDLCGAYATCNPNNLQFCSCVEGFKPKDYRAWDLQDWWSSGCVPRSQLNCDPKNGSSDGFKALSVSLLQKQAYWYAAKTKKDCEKMCLRNCSCTAFSYKPPSGPCKIWSGNLFNINNSVSKSYSEIFIRVALSPRDLSRSSSSKSKTTSIVAAVLGTVAAVAIVLGVIIFLIWRRREFPSTQMSADASIALLRTFSYKELKIATRNFRYKLGSGGFGSVFKGTLPDNTLVAVKKMDRSKQSEKQFRCEITSVGNIQHVNLVRLRGFCAEASQRLLVYEYMPNGSLNSFLFSRNSKSQQKVLEWKTRFEIALGIARGLVYLHENCRDRIIHGDVKPENILLDHDFSPKLADFGLAKQVGRDISHVLTTTRGTRGYLAPEWISGLPITPKVDVYSFGMTLLEIISGRRNLDLTVQDSSMYYFPPWAVNEIHKGNMMNIVDKRIANTAVGEEVRRATLVSLLCVQNDENVRPCMAHVVLMLEGKMEALTTQIPNSTLSQANRGNSDTDSDSMDGIF